MNPESSLAARHVRSDQYDLRRSAPNGDEYRLIVEHSPVMMWKAGLDAQCDYFNERWLAFTGRAMEMEIGNGWAAGVHPDDLDRCMEHFLDSFHRRQAFEMEYRLRRHDGVYRRIVDRGAPLFDRDNRFTGYIGSCVDVEDRRRAEEERDRLRQAEADLAYMSRILTMSELAASIVHDVRQPITAALASAEACTRSLAEPEPDLENVREAPERVSSELTRASDIIDRIRSLYTRGAPRHDTVDLNELAREMIALLDREATKRSLFIRTNLEPGLPSVRGDRVQLQQVLMNLILNGFEAMKDRPGDLLVTTRRGNGGTVLITVTDAGVGLPAEHVDRIFDAFFTTKPQGTGMGLAISRAIVQAHGGNLWAVANDTSGATFQFTLPDSTRAHDETPENGSR